MQPTYKLRLDLQLFAQDKTEPATPKKREEARKKGQVAKSMDLPGALILLFGFLFLYIFGPFVMERSALIFRTSFDDYMLWELTDENVRTLFLQMLYQFGIILLPLMGVAVLFAIAGTYVQIGFLFTGDPLMMKLSKLNPIQGAKNIFGTRAIFEFLKTLLKLFVVALIVYQTIWGAKESLLMLSDAPVVQIVTFTGRLIVMLGIKIGALLVVLAVLDYVYQKYEHEKNLKMSKQEIKDEYKKTEGDPLIKSKIRQKQRAMAMSRMMQEVPKADVIITNPTHFAVALQYDGSRMDAPVVIAKGQDYTALKIKDIAKEHGIITMENKPLARALYAKVEIGQSVPADLFQAVAEVLAYVYKLKNQK